MTEQKINDGGPAFPCKVKVMTEYSYVIDDPKAAAYGETRTTTKLEYRDHPGMTLRDHFAHGFMVGMAKGYSSATGVGQNIRNCMKLDAKLAYAMADAMIAERSSIKGDNN